MTETHAVIERYWTSANERDWETFGSVIAPDVVYECPQTRERVRGHEAYVRFNREFPGNWTLSINRIVGDPQQAVSWTTFVLAGEVMTGLCFFTFNGDGLIDTIKDFWPEPYEPPANRAHLVERC